MNGGVSHTTKIMKTGGPASGGFQTVTKTTMTSPGQQAGSGGVQIVTKMTSAGGGSATIERTEVCHTLFLVEKHK